MTMHELIFVLLCCLVAAYNAQKTTEQMLDDLQGYDRGKRPSGPNGQKSPLEVSVSLYFLDVSTPENNGHEFSAQLYFRQFWTDPRLRYTAPGSESYKTLKPDLLNRIWLPDLFFIEEIQGSHNSLTLPNTFLRWKKDGRMMYSNRYTLSVRCPMNLRFYPHDRQTCSFSIESYGYTADEMSLIWERDHDITIAEGLNDGNFQILQADRHIDNVLMSTGNYTRLRVDIIFKRNMAVFVTKLFMPYILLAIVAMLSVWISPEHAKVRIALILSVLFMMLLLMMEINKNSPTIGYTTALDLWIAFYISFVFSLFLEYILVVQFTGQKQCSGVETTEIELGRSDKDETADSASLPLKQKVPLNHLFKGGKVWNNLDGMSRFVFPLLLVAFNVLYWGICVS